MHGMRFEVEVRVLACCAGQLAKCSMQALARCKSHADCAGQALLTAGAETETETGAGRVVKSPEPLNRRHTSIKRNSLADVWAFISLQPDLIRN